MQSVILGLAACSPLMLQAILSSFVAHLATGSRAPVANILSVPVFVAALGLTRLLAGALERIGFASLRPLLVLQLLLLAGFFALCASAGGTVDPRATKAVFAGMLGVSAMAVQNALVQISLKGMPSTAVMTTNITRFMMDIGEVMFGRKLSDVGKARDRAMLTWPAIVGFAVGCALGAAGEAAIGLTSLALPVGLAVLAVAMGINANIEGVRINEPGRRLTDFGLDQPGDRGIGRGSRCDP